MSAAPEGLPRLIRLAAVALSIEAALYSAVAPLLPHYRDELGLSKPAAGILTASYTGGMVVGSIAGAACASRIGPRRTVVIGFILLAISSLVFGFSETIVLLDGSRAVQGFGAGLIWSGMLAWLIGSAPAQQRGQVLGSAMGAAILGTLFGPVLGTLAVAIGPAPTFAAVAVLSLVIIAPIVRTPAPVQDPDATTDWARARRSGRLRALIVLSLLPGVVMGALNALVPLRLDSGGVSEPVIGGVFLVGALVAAAMSPLVGRWSDRNGRVRLIVIGLGAGAPALLLLGLLQAPWAVAAMMIATFGFGVAVYSVPLMAITSETAEAVGLTAGPAAALLNLCFAGGETIGAPAGAVGADLGGDALPFVVLSAVLLTAAVFVSRRVVEPVDTASAARA